MRCTEQSVLGPVAHSFIAHVIDYLLDFIFSYAGNL